MPIGWMLMWYSLTRRGDPPGSLLMMALQQATGVAGVTLLLMLPLAIVLVLANIFLLIGKIICCQVPRRARAKSAVVTSLVFDAVALVLFLAAVLLTVLGTTLLHGAHQQALAIVALLAAGVSIIALLSSFRFLAQFIKAVAEYLHAGRLAMEAYDTVVMVVALGILWVATTVGLVFIPPFCCLTLIIGLAVIVSSVGLAVYFGMQWIRLMSLINALRAKMAAY
jgi:hypothetical protein